MKTLQCECGQKVTLNYHAAVIKGIGQAVTPHYSWTCAFCGRWYIEKVPTVIVLDTPIYNKEDDNTKLEVVIEKENVDNTPKEPS